MSVGIVRIPTNSLSKNAISDTFISQNRVCELLVIMNYILDEVRQYAMLSTATWLVAIIQCNGLTDMQQQDC